MCWGLQLKLDPCDSDSEMLSVPTTAPTVTFSTLLRGRVTPNPLCGGDFQQPLEFAAHWETFYHCQCPLVGIWAPQRSPTNCWPMEMQNYSHIHSGNYCPGSISRFEKITDNKSSVFPLPTRWYLHFPFPLIHFILWFISHAEAKLFKI